MFFTRGNRQLGYATIIDPACGQAEELDSLTCGHCNKVVWMRPFQSGEAMGGRCTCCDKYICLECVGKGCLPMQKRLDEWERRKEYDQG